MTMRTFKAPTMAMALAQVKCTMGHDAVILHTRTYQQPLWLGLRRREVVEITAGKGMNLLPTARRPAPKPPAAPVPAPIGYIHAAKQLLDTPAASRAMMFDLSEQLQTVKSLVKDLSDQVLRRQTPDVPAELFEYYRKLTDSRVCEDIAVEIIATLHKQIRPEHLQQPQFVQQRLAGEIEKMIPTAGPITRCKTNGAHVVALIGPTGVGKTTTIAKLAANLKIREKRSVGLITIDTYRIAAIEQLRKYANILDSNLRVVSTPEDMHAAVQSMSDCDFILIDTAGRSPNDTMKLRELKSFLTHAAPEEVHLVLSTTCSQEAVELAIEKFADVRVDRMIFTKLDEAPHVGVMLNILRKVNKPLSYVTTGQDVPDDIEVSCARRLAQLILGSDL